MIINTRKNNLDVRKTVNIIKLKKWTVSTQMLEIEHRLSDTDQNGIFDDKILRFTFPKRQKINNFTRSSTMHSKQHKEPKFKTIFQQNKLEHYNHRIMENQTKQNKLQMSPESLTIKKKDFSIKINNTKKTYILKKIYNKFQKPTEICKNRSKTQDFQKQKQEGKITIRKACKPVNNISLKQLNIFRSSIRSASSNRYSLQKIR